MSRIKEWWLRRSKKWKLVIIIVPVAVAIIGVGGAYGALAYFEANPSACGTCHVIQPYVDSYYESDFLDNAHAQAEDPVNCKRCHKYTIPEIVAELVTFIIGDYELPLRARKFPQENCFVGCHGSYEEIILLTKTEQEFNRHESHFGQVDCWVCHKMHRAQEDYCTKCHSALELGPGWIVPE